MLNLLSWTQVCCVIRGLCWCLKCLTMCYPSSIATKWDTDSKGDPVSASDWRLDMISYNLRNNTRCSCVGWQSSLVLTAKPLLIETLFSFLKVTFQVQSAVQAITFWHDIWVHRILFHIHKCHWPSFPPLTIMSMPNIWMQQEIGHQFFLKFWSN